MKLVFLLPFVALISASSAKLFLNPYPRFKTHSGEEGDFGDDDGPLFITPLLKNKKNVAEIQKMAAINHPDLKDFPGYSGFMTVNESTNANLFFWFFPAAAQAETAPVVLWLQGGPGASSLFGLFTENGPFEGEKSAESSEFA
jgi:vitellogenic carboxypeptidase-like protein